MEMIQLVIFDFDGTIVDSKMVYYNSINKFLNPMGFDSKIIDSTIKRGLSLSNTLGELIPSRIYKWFVKKRIMRGVLKEINKVRKCHDANHINDIRTRKILVSNSLSEFVYPVLKHLKMSGVFPEVYCADDFKDKAEFIKHYLKMHAIRPHECFYIGDRVSDIKLAKKLKIHSIIINGRCAWDSNKEILKANPEFVVPDLIYVKRVIERYKG
ncbi:MAG: HAD hydrolase-like protein [archaeon]|jgi:phosphoglycolate phosphatase|nr:HAD hydrolase-like protein [archaeon]